MNARFLTQKINVPVGCLGAVTPMGIFAFKSVYTLDLSKPYSDKVASL